MTLLAFLAIAQTQKPTATAKLDSPTVNSGQPLKGVFTVVFPEGQHGYQNPSANEDEIPIKLSTSGQGFKLTKIDYPKGRTLKSPGADKPSMVYDGTIKIPFTLVCDKPLGAATVGLKLEYQVCTLRSCYPPSELVVKVPLKIVPKAGL